MNKPQSCRWNLLLVAAALSVSAWTAGCAYSGLVGHTATTLPNGCILIAGGRGAGDRAKLYAPAVGAFLDTGGLSMTYFHTATLLPNGKVLIAGGEKRYEGAQIGFPSASAELFDPATGIFTPTGSMTGHRRGHTATLLPNGKVLIAGGIPHKDSLTIAELYDPATGAFTPTGAMRDPRDFHTATLLPNGKVLIAGGAVTLQRGRGFERYQDLQTAELYDPTTGTFAPAGPLASPHGRHLTATLLPNGKVLIAGGGEVGPMYIVSSAEVYDPATGTFTPTGLRGRTYKAHTATLLLDGKVLIAGGSSSGSAPLPNADIYDPATGTFTPTGWMRNSRAHHTATLLRDGRVLVVGGQFGHDVALTAEIYDPATGSFSPTRPLVGGKWYY